MTDPFAPAPGGEPQPGNPAPSYPGFQQPGYEPPSYQQPGQQQPGYEPPSYQQPGQQQPGYEPPSYQQPGYQQPGTQQPGYQQQQPPYPPPAFSPPYSTPPYSAPPAGNTAPVPVSAPVVGSAPPYPYGQPGFGYPPQYPPTMQAPPPKKRTGLVIGVIVAVVVVVVLGSVAAVAIAGRRLTKTDPQGSGTNQAAVSPEAYQKSLDALDQELGPLFTTMVATKHPEELAPAALALGRAITARTDGLESAGAPAQATGAHKHLIEGLRSFGSAVTAFGSSDVGAVCAGVSALSSVSQSTSAGQLRAAITELATADPAHAYKVGAFVPASTPDQSRTLTNGATIKKGSGKGRMVIKNQTNLDIVASVAPTGTKTAVALFYIKAGQEGTYNGVSDGDYDLFLTRGEDWDSTTNAFTRKCAYAEITKTFDYKTTSSTFTVWTITVDGDELWRKSYTDFPL